MQLPNLYGSLLGLLLPLVPIAAASASAGNVALQNFHIAYIPISSSPTSTPTALANISPNTTSTAPSHSYFLTTYTPPKASSASPPQLYRICVTPTTQSPCTGSTTLTTGTILSAEDPGSLVIRLVLGTLADGSDGDVNSGTGASGTPLSVSIHQSTLGLAPAGDGNGNGNAERERALPRLEVVRPAPEPRAFLNKPVVLNAAGRVEEPEKPKTILQKYWWVAAAGLIFVVMSPGGGGE